MQTSKAISESDARLIARIEGLLFASPGLASIHQLAAALGVSSRSVDKAVEELRAQCETRGIRVQRHRGGVQLTTAPDLASDVERFLDLETTSRLTRAATEVLAIVAYEQPVTRPQIDSIRGVNSDSPLRTLLRHGLIEETGRLSGPGRPILYQTTSEFLQHFGLTALQEMPPLVPQELPETDDRNESNDLRDGIDDPDSDS